MRPVLTERPDLLGALARLQELLGEGGPGGGGGGGAGGEGA